MTLNPVMLPADQADKRRRPRHQQSWADSITEYWSHVRALDFALGVGIAVGGGFPITGNLTVSLLMAALMVFVAMCRRPQQKIDGGGIMLVLGALLFVYLVFVSIKYGTAWTQRVSRFSLLLAMAGVIAQRRIDPRSLVLGLCLASVINVPAFYLGLNPNEYPPYLTGWFGDKNVAGMYYAVLGVLGLLVFRRRWAAGWLILSSVTVYLTGSRTSMSAFVLALAWIAFRNRTAILTRLALAAAGVWTLVYVENTFARAGVFSDRTGTDWFRHQIDLATQQKVAVTPWTGQGLNTGFVILGQVRRVWMHNAYDQAFVEGGYVFLFTTLIAFGVVGLGLFSRVLKVSAERLCCEAAAVAILVCAWKIGEGFMTVIGFIVLGLAVGARFGHPFTDSEGAGSA